jgi:hypothetical protein
MLVIIFPNVKQLIAKKNTKKYLKNNRDPKGSLLLYYNHAVIVNNNLQVFKRKNDTKPSAKFNIESIIVTKLYLANEEYPVLRISWLWDDDHDIEFLEISPINPTVKNVFELIELQTQLQKNYSLNTNHKCLNKILE